VRLALSPRQNRSCLVSWAKALRPLRFGGLGVLDLERLGWALHIMWLWFQKTYPCRPCTGLLVMVRSLRRLSLMLHLTPLLAMGDPQNFGLIAGFKAKHMQNWGLTSPSSMFPKKAMHWRTVNRALDSRRWVNDIKGALSVHVLTKYLLV
jgi:hypothetical protein